MDSIQVFEDKPDHAYRTEIPNIIFELGLSIYEMAVYQLLKRIAGDGGKCWQSIKHMADSLDIGETKFRDCLKKLRDPFVLLSNNPLIILTQRKKEDGSPDTSIIQIVPIWRENGDYFRSRSKGGGGSPGKGGVPRQTKEGGSPREDKEEPSQEDLKQQQQQHVAAAVFPCLESQDIPHADKIEISKRYDEQTVKHAIAWATHPLTTLTKGLAPAIKWACKEKPPIPKSPEPRKTAVSSAAADLSDDEIYENRRQTKSFIKANWANIDIRQKVTDKVEFVRIGNDSLYYTDVKFSDLFKHYLKKCNL